MDKSNVGNKLKTLRERKGYTHEEVAYKCDLSTTEYNELESGKRYPSDTSLAILCEVYGITQMELQRKAFVNHDKRKSIINYIQIALATLLVLTYALPFESYTDGMSGFDMIASSGASYSQFVIVKIVFLVLITQLIAHFLLYTNFRKFSNVFKTIFILGNSLSVFLLLPIFEPRDAVSFTYIVFVLFVVLYIIVALYDMILYPLEHDFLQDEKKVRRIFILLANIVYFCLFIWVLSETMLREGYDTSFTEWIFFIVWASYHISYVFMRKRIYENRWISTIMLALPPIVFVIFIISYNGNFDLLRDPTFLFVMIMMLFPSAIVNLDYLMDLVRSVLKIEQTNIE